jgi:ankyrin repeat protein
MTLMDFIRLCGFMLLRLILNPDAVIVIAVGVCFVAALFYSRLRKPYSVLLHLVVPMLVGSGLFAFAVFQNSEAAAWAVVVVPVCCLYTFAGSLTGGLVSRWARRRRTNKTFSQGVRSSSEAGPPAEGLLKAVRKGDVTEIQRCIDAGADINYKTACESALDMAVEAGKLDMVRFLVGHGAKIEHSLLGTSQIRRARSLGHNDIAEFLRNELARR